MDDDIYEDYEQTNKSTGSGLVLAVPAMVLDTTRSDMIDPSKPMVVTGSEYENLSPDNQYYEQVEFVRAVKPSPAKISDCDDSLYSIPQVLSANNSTAGLTTRIGSKGFFMAAIGARLSSVRATVMKGRRGKKKKGEISRGEKPETLSSPASRTVKTVEEMYSKPNKHSLPVLPDSSLVIVTHKTLKMVRQACDDDTKSYMSVHVQKSPESAGGGGGGDCWARCWPHCSCDSLQLKKYFVMFCLVSTLLILLTVGMYFMSGNVVTVTPPSRQRNYILETVDRATTWKDFDQINWGTATTRPAWPPTSSSSSLRRSLSVTRPRSGPSPSISWSGWTGWSTCTSNPCIKGETIARSRKCLDKAGLDADMKICVKQGGVNVEMEPCFCF